MPSSSLRRPVVVEVRPSNYSSMPPTLAPSTPPTPKGVRFADQDTLSRQLTQVEAWSLYNFEAHARACRYCKNPLDVLHRRDSLCDTGRGLAMDVAQHVYYRQGDVYSVARDPKSDDEVHVEVPHSYDQTRSLVRAMNRGLKVDLSGYGRSYPSSSSKSPSRRYSSTNYTPVPSSSRRHAPVIFNDPRPLVDDVYAQPATVIITPSNTDTTVRTNSKERRGTLYERDMQRKKQQDYRVEIREPLSSSSSSTRRRKDERYL